MSQRQGQPGSVLSGSWKRSRPDVCQRAVHTREDLLPAAKAMAAVMCSKNALGLRLTKDAFNAALNGSSLEDANRMEDRNQSLIIANAITEGMKGLG